MTRTRRRWPRRLAYLVFAAALLAGVIILALKASSHMTNTAPGAPATFATNGGVTVSPGTVPSWTITATLTP